MWQGYHGWLLGGPGVGGQLAVRARLTLGMARHEHSLTRIFTASLAYLMFGSAPAELVDPRENTAIQVPAGIGTH